MEKEFEQYKVIIDTDPGVDDTTATLLCMLDERLDIKLFSTVSGNRPVDITTRNMLYVLQKFGFNYPVTKGAGAPLKRARKDAAFLHGENGLGGYQPTEKVTKRCIPGNAEDNIYKVLKQYPKEITILVLGAHTNIAKLLLKYPDAKDLIKQIIFEGGSPYGYKKLKPHISFNISSDPEATRIVLDSGVPIVMVPSELGRTGIYLTEKEVEKIRDTNDFGAFLEKMYSIYWEPGYKDKRIAMNDSCTYMYLTNPQMFKYLMGDIDVNVDDAPGKMLINFHKGGKVKVLMKASRKGGVKILTNAVKKMDDWKETKK